MHVDQQKQLLAEAETDLLDSRRVGLLGLTPVTVELARDLALSGLADGLDGIYVAKPSTTLHLAAALRPLEELMDRRPDTLVVCADAEKEDLLAEALPYLTAQTKLVIAGFAHYAFREPDFDQITTELLVPTIANGYANCLVHLYQCLRNAATLGLSGAVVEFGTYKGGTAAFLAKVVQRLRQSWPVLTLDTFNGFPAKRSALDMYDSPACEFRDAAAVADYTERLGIELVIGDIVETAPSLEDRRFVLSFFDTDNYSSAMAGLAVVQDRTEVGGAIVFDHWVGTDRFRYTLGERFAARTLLEDPRYFNLHGTGVFLRQR
ncbi:MAG: TylF/MycF/NovP-related O-methyltransferase [Pseudonocardia sp.]